MSQMKELYEKVSKDIVLQEKFLAIMNDAQCAGADATKEKLTAFAKDAGYDITPDEMKDYFRELAESEQGALSDAELDMVAGGKGGGNAFTWLFRRAERNAERIADDPIRWLF